MHKTNNITLGGQLFVIEEDAYAVLADYLESIRRHFNLSGDSVEEIMPDIESGLAQHFQERLGENKKYLNLPDVEAVIKEMGTVDDFQDKEAREADPETRKSQRRLYRNPDEAVIGGVCAGLGEYFNVDPVFFRILFVGLVIAGGSGILIYLLLWVAVPEARTTAQKLEMSGGALNLRNLTRHIPSAKEARHRLGQALEGPARTAKSLGRGLGRGLESLGQVVRFLVGLGLAVLGLVIFGISSFVGAIFLFNPDSPYINIPFEAVPLGDYYALLISLYFSIAIPMAFLFILGVGIARKKFRLGFSVWGPLLGFWLLSMIAFGVYAFKAAPGVEEYYRRQEIRRQEVSQAAVVSISGRYFVTLEKSDLPFISVSGSPDALSRLRLSEEGGRLAVWEEEPEYCGLFCRYSPASVTLGSPDFQDVSVAGRAVVSSAPGFADEQISFSFSGNSGANLYLDARQADIAATDFAEVDILGGSLDQLLLDVSGYAYVANLEAPAKDVQIKLTDYAWAKLFAANRLQVATDDWYGSNPVFYRSATSSLELVTDDPDMLVPVRDEDDIEQYRYYGRYEF